MGSVGLPVTSPTFVGRRRELAHLAGALAAAADGQSTTILVAGSSGMGSSRLLSEAERRLTSLAEPLLVLRGGARAARSGEPYAPVLEARVIVPGRLLLFGSDPSGRGLRRVDGPHRT